MSIVSYCLGGGGTSGIPIVISNITVIPPYIIVTWSRSLIDFSSSHDLNNYTITPPEGSPNIELEEVLIRENSLLLKYNGDTLNEGTYSIIIAANTVRAKDDGTGNTNIETTFSGVSNPPRVASVQATDSKKLRVSFTKDMRMDNPADVTDALNLSNYQIKVTETQAVLNIYDVTSLNSKTIEILTNSQELIQYTLYISNVRDLVGNELVPSTINL